MVRTLLFVTALGALGAATATSGCESCPDGNAGGSLYCHAAECSADETVCAGACSNLQTDRDNCGECGKVCGDGMSCSQGACVEACSGTETRCGGTCTDTAADPANCGQCGVTCSTSQVCNGGVCGCAAGAVVCAGLCTDPMTDKDHCGATADCLGTNTGTKCGANEACSGGQCLSTRVYRGSLPQSTGRWMYGGLIGLDGANAECNTHFAGSKVCSADKLMMAQAKGELVNAADYNGVAVTDWWIDDPLASPDARCNATEAENVPWSYATAHKGHYSKYVTLTPATGTITPVMTGDLTARTGLCAQSRFVACCSINTAP